MLQLELFWRKDTRDRSFRAVSSESFPPRLYLSEPDNQHLLAILVPLLKTLIPIHGRVLFPRGRRAAEPTVQASEACSDRDLGGAEGVPSGGSKPGLLSEPCRTPVERLVQDRRGAAGWRTSSEDSFEHVVQCQDIAIQSPGKRERQGRRWTLGKPPSPKRTTLWRSSVARNPS